MLFRSALLLLVSTFAATAAAEPFSFVNWGAPNATNTSVSGTIQTDHGPVGVTLTGGFTSVYQDDVYQPASSFTGGIVGNAPVADATNTDYNVRIDNPTSFTLAFSTPVTNLAYDLWSVGAPGTNVSYQFTQPFDLVAGGPNQRYGGGSLVKSGNTVSGQEGNGTLLFTGTYSTISWNVIGAESYQSFTIGLSHTQVVPEPAPTLALAGGAFALLRRRRKG